MAKELFDCCERRIDRLLILIFDTDGGSVFIWTETEYSCVFKICKRIRRKSVKRLVRHIYENISIFVPITCDTAGRDRDDCYVLPACVYTETTKPLQAHDNIFLFPKADKNWYADASSPTKATLPCPHTISVVWICFLLVFHSAQCAPDRCVLVVLCEHAYFPYAFGENEKKQIMCCARCAYRWSPNTLTAKREAFSDYLLHSCVTFVADDIASSTHSRVLVFIQSASVFSCRYTIIGVFDTWPPSLENSTTHIFAIVPVSHYWKYVGCGL